MDLQRLMDDADAATVAEYIGMTLQRKGKHTLIRCPGHFERTGKEDIHIGNCVLTRHGYHCFSCNTTAGVQQMVMEYTGCGKGQAFEIIAEAMGGKFLYEDADDLKPSGKKPAVERLSTEELECLEIGAANRSRIETGDGTVMEGLTALQEDDPEMFAEIIRERGRQKLEEYEKLLEEYGDQEAHGRYDLISLLGDNFSESSFGEIRKEIDRREGIIRDAIARVAP